MPDNSRSMVLGNVLQLPKDYQQGRTQPSNGPSESSSVLSELSSGEPDDDGYPKNIKWITGPGTTEEKGTMENPFNGKFRIVNGKPVVEAGSSHVITRSKGKQIAKEEEEGSRKDAPEVSFPTKNLND